MQRRNFYPIQWYEADGIIGGMGAGSPLYDEEEDHMRIYDQYQLDTSEKMSVDGYMRHHEVPGRKLMRRLP